ncbi:ABC transporter substrate-binding protein [Thiocapsa rosea]|uniref:ABC transporter substrate-binding protein n=1 Tax=Thiocapsa rosea TaxID=69360 RepID=UPI001FE74CEA|nr:ABC transporter substrate-binding protein [Thiocapsa rosea]
MALRRFAGVLLALTWTMSVPAEETRISIGLIGQVSEVHVPLSALEPAIQDDGAEGARQGIRDNNTTGRFTGHNFEFVQIQVKADESPVAALRELAGQGIRLVLVDLPAADLLALADLPEAAESILFNIGAPDDALRVSECRENLLHTAPSRAMLADALAQYLAWKRWTRWFLVAGQSPEDQAFAAALKRAAKRFGAKIEVEKTWTFEAGARRTDSGHFNEKAAANLFTQVADYDILVVADESDVFGEYLNYRTFRPRPLGGTQGLTATAWSGVNEQWGGTQFQRRFHQETGRWMTPRDYAAWLAVRSIGEAVTRTDSHDPRRLRDYLLGPDFALAAFKGVPVSYRDWNGQLRQPILITSPRLLVSVSPQEGFLHEHSTLDTLGYDRPESRCKR